ncbi:glycoside hydrolase family 5 protein [Cadophora sp. DSE1049]|nr:glycoside hydrolase family 5 protein [Cadophora sp. DSE1049]
MPDKATPAIVSASFTAVPMPIDATPAVISSSFAVSPVSSSTQTPSGISFPSFPTGTGVPAGIFYTGYGSGTGTGTGTSYPQPTGFVGKNGTSNGTYHHPVTSRPFNSTSTSIPFFTLNDPASTPAPILSSVNQLIPASTFVTFSATPAAEFSKVLSSSPSSQAPSPTPTPPSASSANTTIPFLRGVNLGGWLVLEKWMNPDAFTGAFSSAVDQYTFDSISGSASALETHWSTFFTESDIQALAATGLNALRIPIGFWAYDNDDTPYQKGADAYLEKAIQWARNCGMYVWVDLHGSPGSQNGFDNSGQAGEVNWQQPSNLARSISVLKTMAAKYGQAKYADVVVGLELVNEPISWDNNKFSVTQAWAQDAYAAVKSQVENENLVIVMHDAFEGAGAWADVAEKLNGDGAKTFGVDTHLYQLFTDADNALTQAEHITTACGWAQNLASANAIMPTYIGEWSAATNICVNPDGSTTAGTSCLTEGCQCQSAPFDDWNDGMVEQVRRFVEAQLDVFESSSSGYFLWSAKGPGGWGFLNGIGNGAIPNPVTERKYPGQCGGGKRRAARGMLGRGGVAF